MRDMSANSQTTRLMPTFYSCGQHLHSQMRYFAQEARAQNIGMPKWDTVDSNITKLSGRSDSSSRGRVCRRTNEQDGPRKTAQKEHGEYSSRNDRCNVRGTPH